MSSVRRPSACSKKKSTPTISLSRLLRLVEVISFIVHLIPGPLDQSFFLETVLRHGSVDHLHRHVPHHRHAGAVPEARVHAAVLDLHQPLGTTGHVLVLGVAQPGALACVYVYEYAYAVMMMMMKLNCTVQLLRVRGHLELKTMLLL